MYIRRRGIPTKSTKIEPQRFLMMPQYILCSYASITLSFEMHYFIFFFDQDDMCFVKIAAHHDKITIFTRTQTYIQCSYLYIILYIPS